MYGSRIHTVFVLTWLTDESEVMSLKSHSLVGRLTAVGHYHIQWRTLILTAPHKVASKKSKILV